ncbi:hypothetical protein [Sphingobacterium chungjuense]|uniref:hypothetical protein n=1 Tax=Sphingobacterium chungjuense TaxID=2675553 RepID=UPI0019CF8F39|nr:hypothetical protein [Sphingobacterium chungjuense]
MHHIIKEVNMDLDKYKRDYKYRSQEGAHGGGVNKWIIIIGGALVALLAYLTS